MRYRGGRKSTNVENRTGTSRGGLAVGGGIGGIIIVLLVLFLGGGDVTDILNSSGGNSVYQQEAVNTAGREDQQEYSEVVFGYLEDYWNQEFQAQGMDYQEPTMVFYTDYVETACGSASSAVGPFYCPGDQRVYLDLSFADELANQYGAGGDFAWAYVIAHEVGHHVQQELGVTDEMAQRRQSLSEAEYNQYQVRLELQADYYAGSWAKYMEGETINGQPVLEIGDIDEALNAANSIGDDTLQQQAQGYVVPDSFTHGTSAQRKAWFERGYRYGDFEHGDTFNAEDLSLGT
ncbi:neutral zinc metallopeptidase [Enterococcus sp. 669A]|uniref:Neutral zinc metallopeptidase n=1 Tax=Candidatus Enterococcus moelleringii TaxID=2815325 RepID=A0ABS3LBR1_9ENTE|nr:neutral zinc metallopeptidase [Enterococcus sp. 669A]MBO1307075.1 neutral zinc metallopeptidase [Enterococcus sp. 669A]